MVRVIGRFGSQWSLQGLRVTLVRPTSARIFVWDRLTVNSGVGSRVKAL